MTGTDRKTHHEITGNWRFTSHGVPPHKTSQEDAPGTAEKAPTPSAIEAPASGSPENSTSSPTPQEEVAPTHQVEGPQEDQDRIPLDQAISELCGDQVIERPPVPIEANVIVVNTAPAAPASPTPDQDIINVEDNGQEYDSDCQIVEGPLWWLWRRSIYEKDLIILWNLPQLLYLDQQPLLVHHK